MMKMTILRCLQLLIIFIGVIEMIFFSGIFYGMNSLFPSLYSNKMFFNACDTSLRSQNVSRECQYKHYGNLFITGVISQSLLSILCGIFVDKFGALYTKLTTSVVFLLGCCTFAFSVKYWNYAAYLSMILMGISSQGMLLVDLPLGALFPRFQNLIVSIYSGCFDTSTLVFKLIATLDINGTVSLHNSLLFHGFIGLIIITGSTVLLYFVVYKRNRPVKDQSECETGLKTDQLKQITTDNQIVKLLFEASKRYDHVYVSVDTEEQQSEEDINKEIEVKVKSELEKNANVDEKKPLNEEGGLDVEVGFENNNGTVKGVPNDESGVEMDLNTYLDNRYPNLLSIICSKLFLLHSFFFIIVFFRFTFFMAQISLQLKHQFPQDPDLVTELLSSSSLFFLFGVFFTPICGGIVDGTRQILNSKASRNLDISPIQHNYNIIIRSFIAPLVICISFNSLVSIMIMIPSKLAVQFSFVFITFTRAFLFSINSGLLLQVFPVRFFGRLMGLIVFVAGVISFLQYALLLLPSFLVVNYLLIALSILVYLYPVLLILGNVF